VIEHLRVVQVSGINSIVPEMTLSELGHINVICGKNNSGKSSLLDAMHRKAIVGKDADELLEGFDGYLSKVGGVSPPHADIWRRTLAQSLGGKPV
jgi:predicted GTPase